MMIEQEPTTDQECRMLATSGSLGLRIKSFVRSRPLMKALILSNERCVGSSHGWLAICNNNKATVFLLNPVSGSRVDLPSISCLSHRTDLSVRRVEPSSDPSRNKNFFVVVRYSRLNQQNFLAYCKNGDETWTQFGSSHASYIDTSFDKGDLYALRKEFLDIWDSGGAYPMKTISFRHGIRLNPGISRTRVNEWLWTEMNRVDSPGELCLLAREFYIYKLDLIAKEWEKVDYLNDQAIFRTGSTGLMLLSTRHLPQREEKELRMHEYDFPSCPKFKMSVLADGLERVTREESEDHNYCWPICYQYHVWIVPNPWSGKTHLLT